ncbi:MAG: ROK family protein [Clostridia bacterium]|nr:ROK family protein [Clostridia bacterium]
MYTIGIDLGGTNIAIGLCDVELNMIDKLSVRTGASRDPQLIVKDMADNTAAIIERNGLKLSDIDYVGITVPGAVNAKDGVVECTPNLTFSGLKLRESFKKYINIEKVLIVNDANAAALGEALAGAGRGAGSLIMITLGTGVGGGVIMNGRIFSGCINDAGTELGHTVIVHGGRPCACGRRGCWEQYSSASALKRMLGERLSELDGIGTYTKMSEYKKLSARTPFLCAREGDAEAIKLVDEYISYLATGITNIINIFQPELILIGGGISGEGENLTRPLSLIVEKEQYAHGGSVKTKVMCAALGNDAGIIGAAGLGRSELI